MLRSAIYYSSYFFVLVVLVYLWLRPKLRTADILFLIGVILVPIGKLFYLPIAAMVSVKAAFIYTSIIGAVLILIRFIGGISRQVFIPLLFLVPILLSIIFMLPVAQATFLSSAGSTNGTAILRVISMVLTTIYCCYVIDYIANNENGQRDLARYYVIATLFATAVGGLIFYGIFVGQLTVDDILPVTVQEAHVIGRIFRFNPGANVNEFGQIVGYALLILRWTKWKAPVKITMSFVLVLAEFLSLTRGAWVGLFAAYVVYALLTKSRDRTRLLVAGGLAIAVLLVVAFSWSDLTSLLVSRTSLAGGAGGSDRVQSISEAVQAITSSPLRLLFGMGWAADVYAADYGFALGQIHDVPMMLLFDTGVVGISIYIVLLYLVFRFVYRYAGEDRDIVMGILTFMITVSLFEHNFFHVQTWLMFGAVIGLAQRRANRESQPWSGDAQPTGATHG